jgi:hypothetical protein
MEGTANHITTGTLGPSEGFVGARENVKILVVIYWLVTDDPKARGDFRCMN